MKKKAVIGALAKTLRFAFKHPTLIWPFFSLKSKVPAITKVSPLFIKTFSIKEAQFWKGMKSLFISKILPGLAIAGGLVAINAIVNAVTASMTKKKIKDFYLKSPLLKEIPKETKQEALDIISTVAPSLTPFPGIVVPFVKQYHDLNKQVPLTYVETLANIQNTIEKSLRLPSYVSRLPSEVRENLVFLKSLAEIGKMLEEESAQIKTSMIKEGQAIGLIGALIGLLIAKKMPGFLMRVLPYPLLAAFAGFGMGSFFEERAKKSLPRIVYPYQQTPMIPYIM
ncbi:MAG: hypothetical protein QXI58_00870 [Candidatus Micrarchaeia archaeon]